MTKRKRNAISNTHSVFVIIIIIIAIAHQDNGDINLQHLSVLNPAIRGTATHCDTKLNEAYGSAANGAATTNVAYESIEELEPRPEGLPRERGLQANVVYDSITAATTIHTNVGSYESIEGIEPEGLLHERGLQANVAYGSATGTATTIHTNIAYDSIEGIEPRPEGLLQANVAYGSATGPATTIHTNVAYDSIEGIGPRPEGLQHERRLRANEAYDSTTGIGTLC